MQHLLDLTHWSREQLLELLQLAQQIKEQGHHESYHLQWLAQRTVVNLFFEPSTRTRISFELAARRLGAEVINFNISQSATSKGESLVDTIHTITAMGVNALVIRHTDNGAPEAISRLVPNHVHVINAGDGSHAHPTQALLDMLTIQQHKPAFNELKVAIVGDILHSRVARSQIQALKTLGVPEIRIVAPETLLPLDAENLGVQAHTHLQTGVADADVIIMLRLQRERIQSSLLPNAQAFYIQYGLTPETFSYAKPDAIILHPGPVNRDIEIASSLMDHPANKILEQVNNGIATRMAVLAKLFGFTYQ